MDGLTFLASVTGAARASTPVPPGNRHATIDPAYDPRTFPATLPRVTFDGESTLTERRYVALTPYRPVPGDRVLLVPAGNTYVISGAIRGSDPGGSLVRMLTAAQNVGGVGYAASIGTAEADVAGASLSFALRAGAKWYASWQADVSNQVATAGLVAVRLSVGGVSLASPEAHYTSANVAAGLRLTVGASASGEISAAGAVTFKLRRYRVGGTDTDWRMYDGHTGLTVVVAE